MVWGRRARGQSFKLDRCSAQSYQRGGWWSGRGGEGRQQLIVTTDKYGWREERRGEERENRKLKGSQATVMQRRR